MSDCSLCKRALDRDGECPVCHGGGPFIGDTAEWYTFKPGGSMVPTVGKITCIGKTVSGLYFKVRSGKTGKGKEFVFTRERFTRIIRP